MTEKRQKILKFQKRTKSENNSELNFKGNIFTR